MSGSGIYNKDSIRADLQLGVLRHGRPWLVAFMPVLFRNEHDGYLWTSVRVGGTPEAPVETSARAWWPRSPPPRPAVPSKLRRKSPQLPWKRRDICSRAYSATEASVLPRKSRMATMRSMARWSGRSKRGFSSRPHPRCRARICAGHEGRLVHLCAAVFEYECRHTLAG